MVSCADLGTEPDVVDQRLYETLLRGRNWGAIILLDDADEFVHQRDTHNMKRSALVTIFLHQLEYSEGIHFVTTNKLCKFDSALESRTHLMFEIHDFTPEARKFVWTKFVKDIGVQFIADETEILSLVKPDASSFDHMNGRQIRNCLDAALALARINGSTLNIGHIETVLEFGEEFRRCTHESAHARVQTNMRYLGV